MLAKIEHDNSLDSIITDDILKEFNIDDYEDKKDSLLNGFQTLKRMLQCVYAARK